MSDKWMRENNKSNINSNADLALYFLNNSFPSDNIILNNKSSDELNNFRKSIVGDEINTLSDIIWSGNIPLTDFKLTIGASTIRFCIFTNAIESLKDLPDGKIGMIGALQVLPSKNFSLLGACKGTNEINISTEIFSADGKDKGRSSEETLEDISWAWKLWQGVQLALLHPKLKVIFSNGKRVKEYSRVNKNSKRERVVKYIKRHYIYEGDIEHTVKEITRHCKVWYVIGHWRHYKDGKSVYINGYWKGEMRELKRNLDGDRTRLIETDNTVEEIHKDIQER